MSFFGVLVRKVEMVRAIPGADRIELARLEDCAFDFVVAKGLWKPGDTGLYFMIDSLLPAPVQAALGLEGKLSGALKNRIKSVKLRGQVSQGVLGPMSLIDGIGKANPTAQEIAEFLGVVKYEPAMAENGMSGMRQLQGLPGHLSKYDIESAQMNISVLELLMDLPVLITEKVEGQNHCVTFIPGVPGPDGAPGRAVVCTRSTQLAPLPDRPLLASENIWIKLAQAAGLLDLVAQVSQETRQPVTVYSEKTGPGVQGNIYKLAEPALFYFDVKVGGRFLDVDGFDAFGERIKAPKAPVIARGVTLREWLDGRDIVSAAHGRSMIGDTLREGIVVKPMVEQEVPGFGRLILKVRDPVYLASSEN
jgi:RNA ligase (TIGR02306 family)